MPIVMKVIEHGGVRYAEIIRDSASVEQSTFFSPDGQSMQLGILARKAGFVEPPHYHTHIERRIDDLQQMFVVQRGVIDIDFFDQERRLFRTERVCAGDAVLLIHGIHSIRVIEDMQCLSVKQGPFLGPENDKTDVEVSS
jgi:hypothetical protein